MWTSIREILKKEYYIREIIVLFVIALSMLGFVLYESLALFSGTVEKTNVASITAGTVNFSITSTDTSYSNSTKRITVGAGVTKYINFTITNSSPISAKYKVYYDAITPSSLPSGSTVKIAYISPGVESTVLESGASTEVMVAVKNTSTSNLTLEIGVEGGYENNTLSLSSGHSSLSKETIETTSNTTTFSYTGAVRTYTIPETGLYEIEVAGAGGTRGNEYSYTSSTTPVPGKGAKLKSQFSLNKGDVITLVVGGQGSVTQATAKDGTSGAGGGGTFVFKTISSISNSNYQFTKSSTNYEVLMVAAGGGGTGDSSYRGSAYNGKDGVGDTWYSPSNLTAYSKTTTAGTSSNTSASLSSVLGISQFISYNSVGGYYTRNSGICRGGFGGGGCADDNQSYGGGWSGSSYQTQSFSSGDNTSGETGAQTGNGYAKLTKIYSDSSGANAPVLAEGMIPVVYNSSTGNWVKANTNQAWYNYENQMWANAVTTSSSTYRTASPGTTIPMSSINSMWVWIPRYKYRIPSNIGSSSAVTSPPQIDVVFESGTNTTGSTLSSCSITSTSCYYTHPAFRNGTVNKKSTNYDQGGWDEELEGIWVGKFETSGTSTTPTIKPDVISLRSQMVYNQFDTSLKFAGGTRNTSTGAVTFAGNTTYGLTNSTDTHMMKNTEWGAVAYLSQSEYGKNGNPNYTGTNKEIYRNNSSGYYTGRSGGGPSTTPINGTYPDQTSTTNYNTYGFYTYDDYLLNYNTNTKGEKVEGKGTGASTTGTIYGIYDMSGGAYERTMGNWAGTVGSSGFTTSNLPGGSNGSKYYEKYTGTSSSSVTSAKSIKGDATYETMRWYSDNAYFPYASSPWSFRGGSYVIASNAGAFYSYYNSGASSSGYGFRVALIP